MCVSSVYVMEVLVLTVKIFLFKLVFVFSHVNGGPDTVCKIDPRHTGTLSYFKLIWVDYVCAIWFRYVRACKWNFMYLFLFQIPFNSGEVDKASIVGAVQFLSRNVSQILLGFTPTTCQSQVCFAKLNMLTCVYVLMHSCEFSLCMKKSWCLHSWTLVTVFVPASLSIYKWVQTLCQPYSQTSVKL